MHDHNGWRIYQGKGDSHDAEFPLAPPWRDFKGEVINQLQLENEDDPRGKHLLAEVFDADEDAIDLVNAALYLRRPLLITGKPGCGKSSLPYAVARELNLGPVLRWSITSSTKLSDGLYYYDAIGRLQEASMKGITPDIGRYIRLGPLGAALVASEKPRVLLIDEIDKSDIDLPNDLLHVFEEGEFEIPELVRLSEEQKMVEVYYDRYGRKVRITDGLVRCREFPFVVLTSNGEREFPPAFLRRCLRLDMQVPKEEKLLSIIKAHLEVGGVPLPNDEIIKDFFKKHSLEELATDQFLNATYLVSRGFDVREKPAVIDAVLRPLNNI